MADEYAYPVKVSVVMPVYNAAPFLKKAIDSILNQTFQDFEFIIINDASTDSSLEIIQSFTDERIKIISNFTNEKIVSSLNKGIAQAKGEYIARMDADDIALPKRLAMQVQFMDTHPDAIACGTWYKIIGILSQIVKFPTNADALKYFTLHASPICHPSVILRTEMLKKNNLNYDSRFLHSEDYALWCKLLQYGNLYNIPEVLMLYRWNKDATYYSKRATVVEIGYNVRKELIAFLFPQLKQQQIDELASFLTHRKTKESIQTLTQRKECYEGLLLLSIDNSALLSKALSLSLMYHLHCNTHLGLQVFKLARTSKLESPPFIEMVKLFVKCILKKDSDSFFDN